MTMEQLIPFLVPPDLGSRRIKTNEKERIFEGGMHMIDKVMHTIRKTVFNIFSSLTITIKTPIINFSFAPLILYAI
jgi:hypothetical protein